MSSCVDCCAVQDCRCPGCPERSFATRTQPRPAGTGVEVLPLAIDAVRAHLGGPTAERLVADLQARVRLGEARYGEPLRTHNLRDALGDAYQEYLDGVLYLVQAAAEGEDLPVELIVNAAIVACAILVLLEGRGRRG